MIHEILVAEDEEHIAKLIEFKLTRDGHKVQIAKNGLEAIEKLGAANWSLVILDIMMPIYDGWHVLKHIRSSQLAETPVLVLTAKSRQKDIAQADELGATQFLSKPFDPTELSELVKKLFK